MSFSVLVRVSALTVGLSVASAVAGPVMINLSGTFTSGFGAISSGDAVSFSVTYDTSLAPTGGSGNSFIWIGGATLNDFTITTGSGPISYIGSSSLHGVDNDVFNSFDQHTMAWNSLSGPLLNGVLPDRLQIARRSSDISVLSTADTLPTAAQQALLSDVFISLRIIDSNFQFNFLVVNVTSTEITEGNPIPLPGGAAMAMVGMGVIGVRRRRS